MNEFTALHRISSDQSLEGKSDTDAREASRGADHPQAVVQEQADVVVQNLAPGAAARLGISPRRCPVKPSLIVCDISGMAPTALSRQEGAADLLIQSESGFLSVTEPKREPSKAGASIADIAAGMYA
jgi:crotonobetainyl-CoA:carnitine CoA-transferase CaiB-like acyl-CoA transferase